MRLTANAIGRRGRAAGERQHVDAVVAGDLERDRRWRPRWRGTRSSAVRALVITLISHGDRRRRCRSWPGVMCSAVIVGGAHAAGDVVEAAVEQLSPANVVVLLMRVMLSTAESTWSWLAAISSGESAPVLAASTTRSLMFSSSDGDFAQRAFGGGDDVAGALASCRSPG